MSANQIFENSALITGSTEYYSVLFLDHDAREKAVNLSEIIQRMVLVLEHSGETQLHLTRVDWWQKQFKAMLSQQATLPALKQLQLELKTDSFNIQLLEQSLQAMSDEFFLSSFSHDSEQVSWCQRRFGMINMAMAQILGADTVNIAKFIQHTAEVEGYCYLLQANTPEPFTESKQHLKIRAEESWQNALNHLPPDQASTLLPIVIRSSILINRLKKIEKAGYPLYDQAIDVLAIKKFWLAWRWHKKAVNLSKRKS